MTTHENSVSRLRRAELAASNRPFLARGNRMVRCQACLLSEAYCVCAARPTAGGEVAVCLLYYKGEVYKPSNSGRLVADVLADNHAFLWQRTEPDPELLALLANPAYQPLLVFPFEYVEESRQLTDERLGHWLQQARSTNAKPLIVLLDGTWREARKMFRSPWLAHLPVLGISPQNSSQYQLREAFHDHQLGTAEVSSLILQKLGDHHSAVQLQQYFERFRSQYLASKPGHGGD
ncbi:tRNA-uridine aminocarboxypropyltransferase [Oceanobacter mangrovi]|uniref:tRNA-uridine aminocarboxypropyltransferase n=1 Tax=Oceanobacter mangrovi TaxID=2862510 RepID=UPI001C8D0D59|nr:tRNA-uridine aminocarboxypropyltransferase [Oceanobacter mangrovi]